MPLLHNSAYVVAVAQGAPPFPGPGPFPPVIQGLMDAYANNQPNFNRIKLTSHFFHAAAGTRTNENDLLSLIQDIQQELGYKTQNSYDDFIWLWPHVVNSRDVIWAMSNSDFRLKGTAGVALTAG